MFKPFVRYYEFRDQQNYSLEDICGFIERVSFERPFSWSVRPEGLVGVPDVPLFTKKGYIDKVVVSKQSSNRLKVEIKLDNMILLLVLYSSVIALFMPNHFFPTGTSYLDSLVPLIGSIYLPSLILVMRWNQRQKFTDYLERILGLDEVSTN